MSIQDILSVYAVLFGLVFGSYLNVVIFRLPRRISTFLPRSRCPRCRAPIPPWGNIPVLSYLLLLGRCRHCGAKISWRYPLIEIVTGVCFLLAYLRFDNPAEGVIAIVFCCAMIVLGMIDLEHYILPDVITKPGVVLGLVLQPWIGWCTLREAVIGVLLGAGVLAALSWGWYWWKGVQGMGLGDVKMLAMIGAFLGWQNVVITLLLSSLAGSLVGAAMMLGGRMGPQSKLPFGFFLASSAIVTLFYASDLLDFYLAVTGLGPLIS
ncbi:MAG: prepilin peptidase [Acidobacteriota bacterium]